MTKFKHNPFKVKWEELIVKKIAKEMVDYYNISFTPTLELVQAIITRYKQEMEKQKGLKE